MWIEDSLNYPKQNGENLDNAPKNKETNKQKLFSHGFHKISLM